mmetsp:Transcript_61275/g.109099  ORF Transcript_61275/g.109099 Transcript_61275/m.109099 type:complete len:90 (-) Transcript_61275:410-679(-)
MLLSSAARSMDVTAPMDLPHRPMALTVPERQRCLSAVFKSCCSKWPKEIYSPSDQPDPDKSKQKTVMSRGSKALNEGKASSLEEQFPWT